MGCPSRESSPGQIPTGQRCRIVRFGLRTFESLPAVSIVPLTSQRDWWIRLNPARLEILLKSAGKMKNPGFPGAKLKGKKAASTEVNRSTAYRTSIIIVPSSCSPAKDKIEIKKKERENNCLPGEGNSGALSSPTSCAPLARERNA